MILNFLMLLAMYPMMMIVCYTMYVSMKPKNGLAFGCTVSNVRMKDETLKEIERQWSVEMKRNIVITALLPFTAFRKLWWNRLPANTKLPLKAM